jgi:hypothetical protein
MGEYIKEIFYSMHGAFVTPKDYVDPSLKEFESSVMEDMQMYHLSNDKINMHNDSQNIKSDIRKAVKDYKVEHCNV